MPSDPPAAPTSASPSDTALVERARRGDQRALAILYARHAPAVHAHALQAGVAPAAAARVLRDVFRTAVGSLSGASAAHDLRGWLRSLTMDRLSAPRGSGPRLAPATADAVARSGPTLTPEVRDAVWRELERGWWDQRSSAWRRRPATVAATTLVGVLFVAVVAVGLTVREQIRPVTPAGAVTLRAQPMEAATAEEPPPVAPSVIVPRVESEVPFVPPAEPERPEPSPTTPSPTPQPSPTETGGPSPGPSETGTEGPTDEPTSEPPLLPLPGDGDGSEEPPPSPSPSPTAPSSGETSGPGSGTGASEGTGT